MIIFVALGFAASIFQLVILREFSFSIARNELAFVVAAGFWVVFCSLGSIIRVPEKAKRTSIPLLASLAFSLSISLIHLAKSLLGLKYYEATGIGLVLFLSPLLIGPPAFIIGLSFRHFVEEYLENKHHQNKGYAKFFAFEAMGFFLGGLAFTFFLNNYTNPLSFSLLPLALLPGIRKFYKKITSGAIIIALSALSVISFDFILKKELDNAEILLNLGSGYGPVIAARKAGVTSLFSGGSLLATSEDRLANEEFIHMSLSAASPSVKKDVLFIGAGVTGQAEEIFKHNLNSLDFLEINPLISKLSRKGLASELSGKVGFIAEDPRLYLKKTGKKYDAILMNMPAPSALSLNRYFTEEFFSLAGSRLKSKGIFSFTIPSKREVLSPRFVNFNSSIINAIDRAFAERFIIPSDSMIIIASNTRAIDSRYLLENFSRVNPAALFFTIHHFKDYLNPSMRVYAENMLDKRIAANTDLSPSGFLNYLILEQTKFYPNLKIGPDKFRQAAIIFILFFGLIMLASGCLSRKISCLLNIGVIGFSSIGLSSLIFILFQIYCGALYWKLGILIALFMGGLSIGAFLMSEIKAFRPNTLSGIYLLWAAVVFILFNNLKVIGGANYSSLIFYLYSLVCGFLTGSSYPVLAQGLLKNKFEGKDITLAIYSADLIGAFLGTLICGIFLIPFLGVPYTLLTLVLLNAAFALKNLRG